MTNRLLSYRFSNQVVKYGVSLTNSSFNCKLHFQFVKSQYNIVKCMSNVHKATNDISLEREREREKKRERERERERKRERERERERERLHFNPRSFFPPFYAWQKRRTLKHARTAEINTI